MAAEQQTIPKATKSNDLESILASQAKALKAEPTPEEISTEYVWAAECRKCHKPAIWYTRDPRNLPEVKAEHWHTNYKKAAEPWMKREIVCQFCLRYMNEKTIVNMTYVEDVEGFRVAGRAREEVMQLYNTTTYKWKNTEDRDRARIERARLEQVRLAELQELTRRR